MLSRFKRIIDCAYDYSEALEREKLQQESVDSLREKLLYSSIVPKFIDDKQVDVLQNLIWNHI